MSKPHISPLVHDRVRLRLLEEADLPMTRAWRNQDEIRKWFLDSNVIAEDQHRAWFAKYLQRDDDFVFVIEELENARSVGQVSIYRIDRAARTAEFGRLMIGAPDARGRGLASEATACLLDHAHQLWGVRDIVLEVLDGNRAAIHLYTTCGFRPTGHHDGVTVMRRSLDGVTA